MHHERENRTVETTARWKSWFAIPLLELVVSRAFTPQVNILDDSGMVFKVGRSTKQAEYLWACGYRFMGQILIETKGEIVRIDSTLGEIDETKLQKLVFVKLINRS